MATFQSGRDAIAIEVKADLDRGSFAKAKTQAQGLGGEEEVKVRADLDAASFAKARTAQALLTKESARLGDVFNRSSLSIGQMTDVLLLSSPIILDVAGALGALTGSLGEATAGFGALATGAAGAAAVGFGGIAAIAAPAIKSVGEVLTAQKALNKSQTTGSAAAARSAFSTSQQISSARDQVAEATRGVTDAETQLQDAQEQEVIAQRALTQAREDAVRQLQDMRRAAVEGETAEETARIALQRARRDRTELLLSGTASALDIRDAENQIVQARQSLRDTTIQANRDQQDYNEAQRKGVDQMPQVVAAQQQLSNAVQGVKDAQRGVADAHRQVADALENLAEQQKQANLATGAGATQLAALRLAQKKAGPEAVQFAHNLKDLTQRWRRLTTEGRNDFFGLLNDGLSRLNQRLPLFARSAERSMHALRDGFNQFLDRATGPEFDRFINVMTRTFAHAIRPLSRGFGNIALVLERIAIAVSPDLIHMADRFEGMTEGWVESTDNAGKLRDTIHDLVKQTDAWWKLLVAAKDLVVAAIVPGAEQGRQAIKDLTDQFEEWTDWLRAHPGDVRQFFRDGLETTRELINTIAGFIPTWVEFSRALRPISRFFLSIFRSLNDLKIGNVSALTAMLEIFIGFKFIRAMQSFRDTLFALKSTAVTRGVQNLTAATTGVAPVAPGVRATETRRGGLGPSMGAPLPTRGVTGAGGGMQPIPAGPILAQEVNKRSQFLKGLLQDRGIQLGAAFGASIVAGLAAQNIQGDAGKVLGGAAIGLAAGAATGNPFFAVGGAIAGAVVTGFSEADPVENMSQDLVNGLQNLVPRMRGALRHLRFGRLQELQDQFDDITAAAKIFGDDVPPEVARVGRATERQAEKAREGIEDWRNSMFELRHTIFRSLGDIEDQTRSAIRRINRIQGIGNDKREQLITESYLTEIGTIRRAMRQHEIDTQAGNRAIRRITKRLLGEFGVKDPERVIVSDRVLAGLARAGAPGHQQGGFIVPGTGTGDSVFARLPVGSGILNREATNVLLEPRELALMPDVVKKLGGGKAIDLINRVIPRFQAGGMVDPAWDPGTERLNKRISVAVGRWARRYQADMTAGYDPGGEHVSPGHNITGTATDMVPRSGWTGPATGLFERGLKSLVRAGLKVLYGTAGIGTPWPDHGRFNHAHIEWGLSPDVAGGALPQIRLPRFRSLTDVGTPAAAQLNIASSIGELAIREKIRQSGQFGPFAGEAGGWKGINSPGEFIPFWNRTTGMTAFGRAFSKIVPKESGWNPRAQNTIGLGHSGWYQFDPPTWEQFKPRGAPGYPAGPFNPGLATVAAGNVARQEGWPGVESRWASTFSGRRLGGLIAPFLGAFHRGGWVPRDGWGFLQKGEEVIQRQGGGPIPAPETRIGQLRRRRQELQETLRKRIKDEDLSAKETRKLVAKFEAQIAATTELIGENKQLRQDIREHNRLYKQVRRNEKAALSAVVDLTANQIGARSAEQRRNAAAGTTVSY